MKEHPPPAEVVVHFLNVAIYSWAGRELGLAPWGFWRTYGILLLAFAMVTTASKSWRAGHGWLR
jgi:hypothetical protein